MNRLPPAQSIRSPKELQSLLETLCSLVESGLVEEHVDGRSQFSPNIRIADIKPEGPWPDYFELLFCNPSTGKKYKLEVETYHGTGGEWAELS